MSNGALKQNGANGGSGAPVVSGVSAFNGRTGAVLSASGDYSVDQVTDAAPLDSPNFNGNVGIGTSVKYAPLDVVGDIFSSPHKSNNEHDPSERGVSKIGRKNGNTTDGFAVMVITTQASGVGNGSLIEFCTWANAISVTRPVMNIDRYGNVGIGLGAAVASTKLEVNGAIKCTSIDGATTTQPSTDNSTKIASTAFVVNKIAATVASTITPGIVQLNDSLVSTSASQALTANQGKILNDTKAPLDSPQLTGNPQAPTAPPGNKTTRIATTAFVDAQKNEAWTKVGELVNWTSLTQNIIPLSADLTSVPFKLVIVGFVTNFTNPRINDSKFFDLRDGIAGTRSCTFGAGNDESYYNAATLLLSSVTPTSITTQVTGGRGVSGYSLYFYVK